MRWIREHKVFSTVVTVVLILVLVIIISFASGGGGNIISNGFNSMINTVEKPFASFANSVKENISGIFGYKSLQEENEKLKKEIEKLKNSNNNLALTQDEYNELIELAGAFNFEPFKGYDNAVAANIIATDNSMVYSEFTIDVGENKGIEVGDIVVDGNGLVGEVTNVNKNTSKIKSILDSNKNISFKVKNKTDVLGVVSGQGKSKLGAYLLDANAGIVEGDVLMTSGMGHYPAGIIIGKVESVEFDSNSQLKKITVKPTADFKSMQKVAIFK